MICDVSSLPTTTASFFHILPILQILLGVPKAKRNMRGDSWWPVTMPGQTVVVLTTPWPRNLRSSWPADYNRSSNRRWSSGEGRIESTVTWSDAKRNPRRIFGRNPIESHSESSLSSMIPWKSHLSSIIIYKSFGLMILPFNAPWLISHGEVDLILEIVRETLDACRWCREGIPPWLVYFIG